MTFIKDFVILGGSPSCLNVRNEKGMTEQVTVLSLKEESHRSNGSNLIKWLRERSVC